MSASERFEVYHHVDGTINHDGPFDNFEQSVVKFFEVSSHWAKIILVVPSMICVKSYGQQNVVDELKRVVHCTSTNLGGDLETYEVYWHKWNNNPKILHEFCITWDVALERWDAIGGSWAKIIVRTRDNQCVRKYGREDVVQTLKDVSYC